jgi:FkbM family methyltransferase
MFFRKKKPEPPSILREFQNLPGAFAPQEFQVSFLGVLTRNTFWQNPGGFVVGVPDVDDESYEYACILEAAKQASGCFTFVEAGAGYGRWSAIAAVAARRVGKPYSLHAIEAEPQHIAWIHDNMADNDIAPARYHVHPVLVGASLSETPFTVISPQEGMTPRAWYGQAAMDRSSQPHLKPSELEYFGRKVRMHPDGWGTIDVETRPLHEILADVASIDLIDMDIQGSEADAIEASLDFLSARAKRLYIGTHAPAIETRLREMLSASGWTCKLDYAMGKTSPTPLGKDVFFDDGVQYWVNPRLV